MIADPSNSVQPPVSSQPQAAGASQESKQAFWTRRRLAFLLGAGVAAVLVIGFGAGFGARRAKATEFECAIGFNVSTGACGGCADGYFGPNCSLCPDCGLNGQCDHGSSGSGQCLCNSGFSGSKCDVCATGYSGFLCTRDLPGSCLNANCTECAVGFSGSDCASCLDGRYGVDCKLCEVDCKGRGRCDDGRHGSGKCVCFPGWDGGACNVSVASSGFPLIRINVGGDRVFENGSFWEKDAAFLGKDGSLSAIGKNTASTSFALRSFRQWTPKTAGAALQGFSIPAPSGLYHLIAHAADGSKSTSSYHVSLEGTRRIHVTSSTFSGKSSAPSEVQDGAMDIAFSQVSGKPLLNALEVLQQYTIVALPKAIYFGRYEIKSSITGKRTLSIFNAHSSNVTVVSVFSDTNDFIVSTAASFPLRMDSEGSLQVVVEFVPEWLGSISGKLVVVHSLGKLEIPLGGVCDPSPFPLLLTSRTIEFGSVLAPNIVSIAGSNFTQKLVLFNGGKKDLVLSSPEFSGEGNSFFAFSSKVAFPLIVPATKSIEVLVVVKPKYAGYFNIELSFGTNSPFNAGVATISISSAIRPSSAIVYAVNSGMSKVAQISGKEWRDDVNYRASPSESKAINRCAVGVISLECAYLELQASLEKTLIPVYNFNVQNQGTYFVELFFHDMDSFSAGARVFDIVVEDKTVATNVDVYALMKAQNSKLALIKFGIEVQDYQFNLLLRPKVGNPIISAVRISWENVLSFSPTELDWGKIPAQYAANKEVKIVNFADYDMSVTGAQVTSTSMTYPVFNITLPGFPASIPARDSISMSIEAYPVVPGVEGGMAVLQGFNLMTPSQCALRVEGV